MERNFIELFGWWVAVIELPIISALFWMIWNLHDANLKRG